MQVTTIRSSIKKPSIPLMTDHVSKIQAIGKETVARLKDLTAATALSPNPCDTEILQDLCEHHNSITSGMSQGLRGGTGSTTVWWVSASVNMLTITALQCMYRCHNAMQVCTSSNILWCRALQHCTICFLSQCSVHCPSASSLQDSYQS